MREIAGDNLRFWTHVSAVALCGCAWTAAALFFFDQLALASVILLVGLGPILFSAWCTWRATHKDPILSDAEKQRIQGWFKTAGPAAVLQLLLYIHFPGSKIASH